MSWEVWLKGEASDLESLCERFKAADPLISKRDGGYVLTSKQLDAVVKSRLALDEAVNTVRQINEVLSSQSASSKQIQIDRVTSVGREGVLKQFVIVGNPSKTQPKR